MVQSKSKLEPPENSSLAVWLASLNESERNSILSELTDIEARELLYSWATWARPSQIAPPGKWLTWLILAGRGFGKTRTGAEWVRANVNKYERFILVARTAGDVRDVMVEGESGLLSVFPPDQRPRYEPSKRKITFTNGAVATTFGADEPDLLRGPQCEAAWADELATWRYPEAWDNLQLGLRLGNDPRQVVTTTPKPVRLVRDLVKNPSTVITRGSTYENLANLAPTFAQFITSKYEGTTIGRQELYAELLDEYPGAFWTRAELESHRVQETPELERIVIAIDPAVTAGDESDQTAIVVAGRDYNRQLYVIHAEGMRVSPQTWATRSIDLYDRYEADRIIAERNNGGDMVEATIRQVRSTAPVRTIHASRGKTVRAEPIAALYEQGRVHHVGALTELEDQLVAFPVATDLDDLVDADVYALTDLAQQQFSQVTPAFEGLTQSNPWW